MVAVSVEGVFKHFRIYRGREDTLKGAFVRALRPRIRPHEFWALRDVSFSVAQGETFGIIGENGSGKSTMLKILCGILKPDEGRVQIQGRIAALLELGAGFHPDLTGRENIYLNASLLGFSKNQIEKRFDEIVEFAGIRDFIDTPIKHYSSGMQVRLGFAIAVNVDPDVLLIDEVLAVGDEAFQKKCKQRMDAFKAQGKTIVIVTHDLNTVEHWCSNALWLEKGKAEVCGTAPGVVGAYRDRIMARLETSTRRRAEAPESGGKRWGDRRIEITEVQLLDEAGKARMVFTTGKAMTIVIRYKVQEPIDNPVFGFALMRADGLWCYGSNTRIEDIELSPLTQDGSIEICLDKTALLPDSYFVDVAVETVDGVLCDYRTQTFPFEMCSAIKDVGVFRPGHVWKLSDIGSQAATWLSDVKAKAIE